jgi:archaemetzincin
MFLWLQLLALVGLVAMPAAAAPLSIRLIAVGAVPPAMMGFLQEGLRRELGADVRLGESLPMPASCPEGRKQYPAEPFLEVLAAARPPGPELVLGVTGVDLTFENFNFIFGLADAQTHCAVITLARLYPEFYGQPRDPRLFKERALKEAIHEIGHLMGLHHCSNPTCIMFFSNSIVGTDRKGPGFCQECRKLLRQKNRGEARGNSFPGPGPRTND